MIDRTLYVIAVVSNFRRFKRRIELYRQFKRHVESFTGIQLLTVEMVLGDRPFEITTADNPWNVQLVADSELWHKENMINIGVGKLPKDWKYMAYIDADITFINTDWVQETLNMLQHHKIVQMWQTCTDLGPDGRVLKVEQSFAYRLQSGQDWQLDRNEPYKFWHPGYAWAVRRDGWDQMGGLLEFPILGSADHHMALCWIGHWELSVPPAMGSTYKLMLKAFQDRSQGLGNIGYVKGNIAHHFHGSKQNRKYNERWGILISNNYDPIMDTRKDYQGVLHLNGNKPKLIIDIQHYFQQRNEDSIDEPCSLPHKDLPKPVNHWSTQPPAISKVGIAAAKKLVQSVANTLWINTLGNKYKTQ